MVYVETKAMLRSGCQRVGSDPVFAVDAPDRLPYQNHVEGTGPVPAGENWLTSTALRYFKVSDNEALHRAER